MVRVYHQTPPQGGIIRHRFKLRAANLLCVTLFLVLASVWLHSISYNGGTEASPGRQGHQTGGFLSQSDIIALEEEKEEVILPPGLDVVDIGASKGGGSMNFMAAALKREFGKNADIVIETFVPHTLGIDIDPSKVESCLKLGENCIRGDILQLSSSTTAGGTTMWHVMEHMPTCEMAKRMFAQSASVSRGFVSFRGPSFDREDSLKKSGFHRYFENWTGHPCHFNSTILNDAIVATKPEAYVIIQYKPILSSGSNVLLPNGALRNSHHFDPIIHPKKETVGFDGTYHEEMRACAVYKNSLGSALCLKDALAGKGGGGFVSHCSSGPSPDLSAEDCSEKVKQMAYGMTEAVKSDPRKDIRHWLA